MGLIPVTARTCKRFQGFGSGTKEHGVADLLMAHAAMAVDKNLGPLNSLENCCQKGCTQPTARSESEFYLRHPQGQAVGEEQLYTTARAVRHLINRVGLDSSTGISSPGILYSLEVMSEGQIFLGDIYAGDEASELLASLLVSDSTIYVGQARSRGLGFMEIISFEALDGQDIGLGMVAERLAKFNKVLSGFIKIKSASYFSLDLQSDAIIQDAFMRYLGCMPTAELANYMGLAGDCLELVWYGAEGTPVRGWNSAHRMPKPGEVGIRRGSVFLYRYNGTAADLHVPLERLEEMRIGRRRAEGYGRVLACNPFHWEVRNK